MLRFLHAEGPAPDRAARMMLYGQFVGSWDGTVVVHEADGARRESSCEVHFGWALEGRAMTGGKIGEEIVQEYVERGARRQWLFTEITAESFHWLARKPRREARTGKSSRSSSCAGARRHPPAS
jgi:hypothetical protein